MANLASRLKKLRKDNNLLQKDLASDLKLAQTTIANYEKNARFPNQETLNQIADYFNVSLDYLLGRTDINANIEELVKRKSNAIDNLNKNKVYSDLTEKYFDYLIKPDKKKAFNLILQQMNKDNKIDINQIYMKILEPALKKIGHLWEINKVSVDQEHIASEITTQIIYQLHSYFPHHYKNHKTMIGLTAGGELHEIGIKMVTDLLELNGWHTFYLGTNTPISSIIKAVHKYNPDLIAISATMSYHINSVENIITSIKNETSGEIKFMVGGQVFNLEPNLWKKVKADGLATNAEKAVKIANQLVEN